jgi:predicted XRE-type DNA-binding protein
LSEEIRAGVYPRADHPRIETSDFARAQAGLRLLKARLTLQIYKIIKARGRTQARAGELLGIKQPHVSALMRNRAGNFSVGRLIEFLNRLGQDVEITVKPIFNSSIC